MKVKQAKVQPPSTGLNEFEPGPKTMKERAIRIIQKGMAESQQQEKATRKYRREPKKKKKTGAAKQRKYWPTMRATKKGSIFPKTIFQEQRPPSSGCDYQATKRNKGERRRL